MIRTLAAALATTTCFVALATPAAAQTREFNVPAGSLRAALDTFARQSGRQVIYRGDEVGSARSPGVRGTHTAEEALDSILAGTGFRAQRDTSGAFAVAKVGNASATADASSSSGEETSADSQTDQGPEIVVTGSHIRNVEALTPVIKITSEDLAKQGYSTLTEAFQQLPQNFKAGVSSESNPSTIGEGASKNYGYSSGVNLRGIGPGDTLVLLNGRRLPPTAYGGATDISGIPISAIDRVEILTDGASAVYGSDAVAGVVNIITKKNYEGIETGVRAYGISRGKKADLGGYIVGGYNWGTGGFTLDYDYEKLNPLPAAARPSAVTTTLIPPSSITPSQNTSSFYGSFNQAIAPQLTFSADGIYSSRAYRFDRVGVGSIYSSEGRNRQLVGSAEFDYALPSHWLLSVGGTLGHESDHNQLNYESFGLTQTFALSYKNNSVELRADGPLLSLPAGKVRLAVGANRRWENFTLNEINCFGVSCRSPTLASPERSVSAVYGEILIPLIGEDNQIPFIHTLTADVAGRFDRYSDFGNTTNPKVTLQWSPVSTLKLNGSFATSFKAPDLFYRSNIFPSQNIITYTNGLDASQGVAIEVFYDLNPHLRPETAKTITAGGTWTPRSVPGLTLRGSYFDINYKNKIINLFDYFGFSDLLANQSELGNLLTLNPSITQVNAQLASTSEVENDVGPFTPADVTAIANTGTNNAAGVRVKGIDYDSRYDLRLGAGTLSIAADGSYYLSYRVKATPTSASQLGVGLYGSPPRFRTKLNIGWVDRAFSANARMNYVSSGHNQQDLSCGPQGCRIGSWTTFDLAASYSFMNLRGLGFLNGARISAAVANVFDRDPPFAKGSNINYDPVNANPLGRTFSVSLIKRW